MDADDKGRRSADRDEEAGGTGLGTVIVGRGGIGKDARGAIRVEQAILQAERIEAMLLDSAWQDPRTFDVSKIAIALDGPPEGPAGWHIDRIERGGTGYSPGDFDGGQTPPHDRSSASDGEVRALLDAVAVVLRENYRAVA
ncbi:hypothetical protein [Segnochrobactrum spirostomi]|uniref:Uncharacterized protein n=1 Tax=Segnochrobactrum spirostomi TaxID=2608987 RepID=A0A6A7Y1B2_9HYPH|nr:hypothetical protein [Segnochrobactrum spirostomi]MQT11901.1 hypothetical protein [Segnochrobactrum spirostomi]